MKLKEVNTISGVALRKTEPDHIRSHVRELHNWGSQRPLVSTVLRIPPGKVHLHTPLPTNASAQFPTAISTPWDTACVVSLNTRSLLDRTFFHPSSSSSLRPQTHRASPFVIRYTSSNARCARRTAASVSPRSSIDGQQCRYDSCSRISVVGSTLPSASCGYAREYGGPNSEFGPRVPGGFDVCPSFAVTFVVAPPHMYCEWFVYDIWPGIGRCDENTESMKAAVSTRGARYAPRPFTRSAEGHFGEPIDLSEGVFHAHGCVGGSDLHTKALRLSTAEEFRSPPGSNESARSNPSLRI